MNRIKVRDFNDLKSTALKVEGKIVVCWPQHGRREILNFPPTPNLNGKFSTNRGIIAFVSSGTLYVIPHTTAILNILLSKGFSEIKMYVPFSNFDYPVGQKDTWEKLLMGVWE